MRVISPSYSLGLRLPGNVLRHAYVFADIDGDGVNELAVGTMNGTLSIFKDRCCEAVRKTANLGTISALTYGSVYRTNINYLVVCTSEGWIYLFRCMDCYNPSSKSDFEKTSLKQGVMSACKLAKPEKKQLLLPNAKMIKLCDTDGDGQNELIIAYADRRVRVFTYSELAVDYDGCSLESTGKFVLIAHWTLDGQIGTITIDIGEFGRKKLIASQPGGTFIDLNLAAHTHPAASNKYSSMKTFPDVFYNPVASVAARVSPTAFTEALGSVASIKPNAGTNLIIGTSDGLLILMHQENIMWTEKLEGHLVGVDKLDLNGDNADEVIACTETGTVYIVDSSKNIIKFQYDGRVSNFCAGHYGLDGVNNPVLCVFTFYNEIVLYYKVNIGSHVLMDLLMKINNDDEQKGLMERINELAREQGTMATDIITETLYHFHKTSNPSLL